jgi:hypothetical protein
MILWASGIQFDWSISLGNLISGITFLVLALFAWRDLTWRVKNLETWRAEHMLDSDSRDKLIMNSDKMLARLQVLMEDNERWKRGEERRKNN